MNEKPNYDELAERIDFAKLAGRIGQLSESDNPRRKAVHDLLDKVREEILAARERRVSYAALAKELTTGGLPITEPTLRKYLQIQGVTKRAPKPKRATTRKNHSPPGIPTASDTAKP